MAERSSLMVCQEREKWGGFGAEEVVAIKNKPLQRKTETAGTIEDVLFLVSNVELTIMFPLEGGIYVVWSYFPQDSSSFFLSARVWLDAQFCLESALDGSQVSISWTTMPWKSSWTLCVLPPGSPQEDPVLMVQRSFKRYLEVRRERWGSASARVEI